MTVRSAAPLLLLLAGCDLPRDPDGTTDRVRAERSFRVGLIAGDPGSEAPAQAFLARVQSATGARPSAERGAAEPLLAKLRDGELDLVIGAMSPKSPWEKEVHVLPALAERIRPGSSTRILAIAAHGENRWIALLDRAARDMAGS